MMAGEYGSAKIRYLIVLLEKKEEGASVTELAKLFGVAKSTISRAMDSLRREGLVSEKDLSLTAQGEKLAVQYKERHTLLCGWLHKEYRLARDTAVQDAYAMLGELSEEALGALTGRIRIKKAIAEFLSGEETGAEGLSDGVYPLKLTFYRTRYADGRFISMADEGFSHTGLLCVRDGKALIRLEAAERAGESKLGGLILRGSAQALSYDAGGEYRLARKEDCFYFIPASACTWKSYREEGRLIGVIGVRLRVSVPEQHMPESEAVLVIESN